MGQAKEKRSNYAQLRTAVWQGIGNLARQPLDQMLIAARALLEQAPTIEPQPSKQQIAALKADIEMLEAARIFTAAVMVIGQKLAAEPVGPSSPVEYVNGKPAEVAREGREGGDS